MTAKKIYNMWYNRKNRDNPMRFKERSCKQFWCIAACGFRQPHISLKTNASDVNLKSGEAFPSEVMPICGLKIRIVYAMSFKYVCFLYSSLFMQAENNLPYDGFENFLKGEYTL